MVTSHVEENDAHKTREGPACFHPAAEAEIAVREPHRPFSRIAARMRSENQGEYRRSSTFLPVRQYRVRRCFFYGNRNR
jgi:hypothetical protein